MLEDCLRRTGRSAFGHRFGTAGKDDAARREFAHEVGRDIVGVKLTVDVSLAYATRDQLGVLGAEIEDQDAIVHRRKREGEREKEEAKE